MNMVRTKILISAHHGHAFNSGANTNFFFLFILTVWLLLVRVPHFFKQNNGHGVILIESDKIVNHYKKLYYCRVGTFFFVLDVLFFFGIHFLVIKMEKKQHEMLFMKGCYLG